MAEYPKDLIAKLDAQSTKEAWPLIGYFLMGIVYSVIALFLIGQIFNKL